MVRTEVRSRKGDWAFHNGAFHFRILYCTFRRVLRSGGWGCAAVRVRRVCYLVLLHVGNSTTCTFYLVIFGTLVCSAPQVGASQPRTPSVELHAARARKLSRARVHMHVRVRLLYAR